MNQIHYDVHVRDLGFPEGPVALADGSVAFVDLLHARIRRWHPDDGVSVLAELDGAPNGMCLGREGKLWIANNGGIAPQGPGQPLHHAERPMPGGLQELDLRTGAVQVITQGGVQPDRPNDVVVSPEGHAVFTDPQNWEVLKTNPEAYLGGRVLVRREDGTVALLTQLPGFPNGLIFHPNGDLLVNLTRRREVIRFRWHNGRVAAPELFCSFPEGFAPDGMCLTDDRLLVAGSVGDMIAVVGLDGRPHGLVSTGPHTDPTNLCISQDRVFITNGFARELVSVEIDRLLREL